MLDTIPFTSVHSNLEHGLAILTQRALVHSDLSYTTSLVEVQSRSDATSYAIPDTVYLACVRKQF